MSDNFPKKVYLTMDAVDDNELYLNKSLKSIADTEEQDTLVAEYVLVRVGTVQKSSKVAFE